MSGLVGKDILSAFDFERQDLFRLFILAERLKEEINDFGILNYAVGKLMVTAFFEPSTRTKVSFQFAMKRLGGDVIDFIEEVSSLQKGETEEDTMRILDGYDPDVIVVRHSKPFFPHKVKDMVKAPIINGGDGTNEHPTQALLDVYTIWKELGRVDGVVIGMMGDLKYGRTIPSLSYMLTRFNDVTIYFISPKELQVREEVIKKIEGKVTYYMVEKPEDVMEKLDVLYVTRLQKERFSDPQEYERLKGSYKIERAMLQKFKRLPIIMHPLPRVWELSTDVDDLPQAKYFNQAKNGVYIRAALLKEVLGV
ncbi:MAG: aspartate carbamoyltransferase [Zestosphaera tikiterensis]|uniref:Aspartate carbamoyltransferase n=1 Tax=Zestosphaera tikiterensis TaxID=1973259 RepID=A0A2R7Y9M4_9CREN|nr:MAG: aspartate carbamoyltransferase [Zestosphaera tikiterensis]